MAYSGFRPDFPTSFVIFGATGDLARTKLFPALINLHKRNLLSKDFSVVAFSRRPFSHDEFRAFISEALKKAGKEAPVEFLRKIYYVQGTFDTKGGYQELSRCLIRLDREFGHCSNKLFHLAVSPAFYPTIFEHLSESGLTIPCGGDEGWTRVLVEKPFGRDIKTARDLDKRLGELFQEEQIFRIDHYLAKETIQNILSFRFFNPIFAPLWNTKQIESVHIKLLEEAGVGTRGMFYDGVGALRDVGQNHVLQMLALIAMDRPVAFDAVSIRKARLKVLKSLKTLTAQKILTSVSRGQYEGFTAEEGVKPNSDTETYVRISANLTSPKWRNTPFILEAGKGLAETKAEITIRFRPLPLSSPEESGANKIVFHIQPDESIRIRFFAKKPGFDMKIEEKDLSFSYKDFNNEDSPLPYERVLYDCIRGDQTLFASTEEVEASWKWITPIIDSFSKIPLVQYMKGSNPKI
jgi:glucose-6-phosphate 1-dehydrogenase